MAGALLRAALNKDWLDLESRCVSSTKTGANLMGGHMWQDKTQSTLHISKVDTYSNYISLAWSDITFWSHWMLRCGLVKPFEKRHHERLWSVLRLWPPCHEIYFAFWRFSGVKNFTVDIKVRLTSVKVSIETAVIALFQQEHARASAGSNCDSWKPFPRARATADLRQCVSNF